MLLYDRKRAYILIAAIIFLLSATTIASYAFNRPETENYYTINDNGITTTFKTPTNQIVTNLDFIKEETNLQLPKYNFTVKNTSVSSSYYTISIKLNNQIDQSLLPYIKVIIDNEEPKYLIEEQNSEFYTVYLGELNSKVANTHNLSIYLSNRDSIGNELIDINYLELDFSIIVQKSDYTPDLKTNLQQLAQNSDQLYTDEHGNIRFYGANPNNYIQFNDELWRIIGIIKTKTNNQEEELIKIVRADALLNTSIDYKDKKNYSSNFQESQLYAILNQQGYWTQEKVSCPNSADGKAECDFTTNGLKPASKELITEVFYTQGGWNTNKISPSSMYLKENSIQKNSGHVLLLTPSDYGYAAGPNFQNVYFDSFAKSPKNSNWLAPKSDEWLLAPNVEDYRKSYSIAKDGQVVSNTNVTKALNIRPVVFLKPGLQSNQGTGTKDNPYILSDSN